MSPDGPRERLEAVARDLGGYGPENIDQFLRGDFSCASPEDVIHLKQALNPGPPSRLHRVNGYDALVAMIDAAVEVENGDWVAPPVNRHFVAFITALEHRGFYLGVPDLSAPDPAEFVRDE